MMTNTRKEEILTKLANKLSLTKKLVRSEAAGTAAANRFYDPAIRAKNPFPKKVRMAASRATAHEKRTARLKGRLAQSKASGGRAA